MPLHTSPAYSSPRAAAGDDSFALVQAWSRAVQAYLTPTSRQWDPFDRHPLTKAVASQVRLVLRGARRKLAERLLDRFCAAVTLVPVDDLPPLRAQEIDDGS